MRILGSPPQLPTMSECANKDFTNLSECSLPLASQANWINAQRAIASKAGVTYVDVLSWLCYRDNCPRVILDTVVTAYQHLSQPMGRLLSQELYASISSS